MKYSLAILFVALIIPCEAYAAGKTTSSIVSKKARTVRTVAKDYNCSDFSSREQAMKVFVGAGGPNVDTYRLDGDRDGIPCENLK